MGWGVEEKQEVVCPNKEGNMWETLTGNVFMWFLAEALTVLI